MSSIELKKTGITDTDSAAVVNRANEGLWQGGGVCGVIFRAAGADRLREVCEKIGHCDTGSAVITPGFDLCQYIIHAVGPVWRGGENNEEKLLYNAYYSSLKLCIENDIHTVTFPLISAGIFGFPVGKAWHTALKACNTFISRHRDFSIEITFAVIDDRILQAGIEETGKQK